MIGRHTTELVSHTQTLLQLNSTPRVPTNQPTNQPTNNIQTIPQQIIPTWYQNKRRDATEFYTDLHLIPSSSSSRPIPRTRVPSPSHLISSHKSHHITKSHTLVVNVPYYVRDTRAHAGKPEGDAVDNRFKGSLVNTDGAKELWNVQLHTRIVRYLVCCVGTGKGIVPFVLGLGIVLSSC